MCQARRGAPASDRSAEPAAGPVPPDVLAQPAARPMADLGPRAGAAGRRSRSSPSPAFSPTTPTTRGSAATRSDGRSARSTSTCSRSRPTRAGSTPLTQGLHVTIGLAAFPILLAKLWSVIPKLFEWPPVRSPAHALERLSLALLVGGALFEFATGILNIQYAYLFPFFFTTAHYYGAWVFIGGVRCSTPRSSSAPCAARSPRGAGWRRCASACATPRPSRRARRPAS